MAPFLNLLIERVFNKRLAIDLLTSLPYFCHLTKNLYMSVLEKIRSKSGLAIVVVGGALALFVISDALQSNSRLFGGNDTTVGSIDGEDISVKLFEQTFEKNIASYKQRAQTDALDQNTVDMVREQTWNQLVLEGVMESQYADLGISVSNAELLDLVQGEEPHPQIKSAPIFQNQQTGQYDRTLVVRFLKQMSEGTDETAKAQWLEFENGIAKEAEAKKFNNLLKKGVYATSLEAKNVFASRNRFADLEAVALNYFSIADSTITADDAELQSYFKQHYNKYKEKDNLRKLEFVVFDLTPTGTDSAAVQKWVNDQIAQFAQATNDTLYVDANSETRFDTLAHPRSFYPEEVQAALFSQPVGAMVGPIFTNGKYRIYKVSGIKNDSTYQMRASHILFKIDNGDTAASLKKAQEVLGEIRRGADFGEKAAQYGTDGTASRGGDLGWFGEGQMVKEFNDYVKRGKKGDIGIVKTQFGIHIVKVTEDKTNKTVCAGVLERSIDPSELTVNAVYNNASQFAAAALDGAEAFETAVTANGLSKRVADNLRENDKTMAGIAEAREIVRWGFNAKVGDVSEVLSVSDKYIVAKLVQIKEKGKANFEDVKERVTADYRKEKKAEQLLEKATAAVTGATALQDIATKLQVAVTPITSQTFENANVAYIGPDATFIGTVFGTKTTGKILGPVKGDNAVYIYNISKFTDGPNGFDATAYQTEIQNQLGQRLEYGSFDVLKQLRNVEDFRYKFY